MFRSRTVIVSELWVFTLRRENRKYILRCDRVTAMWGELSIYSGYTGTGGCEKVRKVMEGDWPSGVRSSVWMAPGMEL